MPTRAVRHERSVSEEGILPQLTRCGVKRQASMAVPCRLLPRGESGSDDARSSNTLAQRFLAGVRNHQMLNTGSAMPHFDYRVTPKRDDVFKISSRTDYRCHSPIGSLFLWTTRQELWQQSHPPTLSVCFPCRNKKKLCDRWGISP